MNNLREPSKPMLASISVLLMLAAPVAIADGPTATPAEASEGPCAASSQLTADSFEVPAGVTAVLQQDTRIVADTVRIGGLLTTSDALAGADAPGLCIVANHVEVIGTLCTGRGHDGQSVVSSGESRGEDGTDGGALEIRLLDATSSLVVDSQGIICTGSGGSGGNAYSLSSAVEATPPTSADESAEPECRVRSVVEAIESQVVLEDVVCWSDSEVINASQGADATWLYGADAASTCTLLSWTHDGVSAWYGTTCYNPLRLPDANAFEPCSALSLPGKPGRDLCGSNPFDSQGLCYAFDLSNAMACGGSAPGGGYAPPPPPPPGGGPKEPTLDQILLACIGAVADGPVVLAVPQSEECDQDNILKPCPAPETGAGPACLPACDGGATEPECAGYPCASYNLGVKPVCLASCPSDKTGYSLNGNPATCVTPPQIPQATPCPSGKVGSGINGNTATCVTPPQVPQATPCPSGKLGYGLNGNTATCITPPQAPQTCDSPYLGVKPTCYQLTSCSSGRLGYGLNGNQATCITEPQPPQAAPCASGKIGYTVSDNQATCFSDPCPEGADSTQQCGSTTPTPPDPCASILPCGATTCLADAAGCPGDCNVPANLGGCLRECGAHSLQYCAGTVCQGINAPMAAMGGQGGNAGLFTLDASDFTLPSGSIFLGDGGNGGDAVAYGASQWIQAIGGAGGDSLAFLNGALWPWSHGPAIASSSGGSAGAAEAGLNDCSIGTPGLSDERTGTTGDSRAPAHDGKDAEWETKISAGFPAPSLECVVHDATPAEWGHDGGNGGLVEALGQQGGAGLLIGGRGGDATAQGGPGGNGGTGGRGGNGLAKIVMPPGVTVCERGNCSDGGWGGAGGDSSSGKAVGGMGGEGKFLRGGDGGNAEAIRGAPGNGGNGNVGGFQPSVFEAEEDCEGGCGGDQGETASIDVFGGEGGTSLGPMGNGDRGRTEASGPEVGTKGERGLNARVRDCVEA